MDDGGRNVSVASVVTEFEMAASCFCVCECIVVQVTCPKFVGLHSPLAVCMSRFCFV